MGRIGGELDGPGEGLDLSRIHLVARPCILHSREQRDVLARFGPGRAGLESDGGGDVERLRDHLHGDGRRARSDPGAAGDIPGFDPLIPELGELVGRDAGLALAVHFDVAQRDVLGTLGLEVDLARGDRVPLAAPFTLAVKVMFAPVTAVGNDAWRTVIEETFARDAAAEAPVPLSRVRASRVSRLTCADAGRRRESLPHRRGRVRHLFLHDPANGGHADPRRDWSRTVPTNERVIPVGPVPAAPFSQYGRRWLPVRPIAASMAAIPAYLLREAREASRAIRQSVDRPAREAGSRLEEPECPLYRSSPRRSGG